MQCTECKSTNIKIRKNYSHGKKSKAKSSKTCKDCGSTNIEMPRMFRKFKRK